MARFYATGRMMPNIGVKGSGLISAGAARPKDRRALQKQSLRAFGFVEASSSRVLRDGVGMPFFKLERLPSGCIVFGMR